MARRRRNEPMWPLVLVLGLVAGGLVLGALITGDADPGPALSVTDLAPGAEAEAPVPSAWDRVRVEVLNGGGVPGAAAAARDELRDRGFDVVYYGNADSFGHDTTVVLDRGGAGSAAAEVARAIGVSRIRSESDSSRLVDVTVLLGADWETDPYARAQASEVGDAPGRPWWDLRRLFTGAR